MDVHFHWFGLLSVLSTGLACTLAVCLALVALVKLRPHDPLAASLVVSGAALEIVALLGGIVTTLTGVLAGRWFADPAMAIATVATGWSLIRPLFHALALAALGFAILRLGLRLDASD